MPIDTQFEFSQLAKPPTFGLGTNDLRGLLAGFVGNEAPNKNAKKTWKGTGFNLIWRPNFGGQSGPKDFFLELTATKETLDFTDITGATGIANRGLLQKDIAVGGITYLQQIADAFDGTAQHFEPGLWLNVPNTTNPLEPQSVSRLGSIPHGTSINLQGVSFTAPEPVIDAASITPFAAGSPDDGKTGLVHFPEETTQTTSRTDFSRVPGLTQNRLTNPNLYLTDALVGHKILHTTVLVVASSPELLPAAGGPIPGHVDSGGGITDIAFLDGGSKGPPNAKIPAVTATFWIETVQEPSGATYLQLQYTQRVLLTFNNLSWPHITVATLR